MGRVEHEAQSRNRVSTQRQKRGFWRTSVDSGDVPPVSDICPMLPQFIGLLHQCAREAAANSIRVWTRRILLQAIFLPDGPTDQHVICPVAKGVGECSDGAIAPTPFPEFTNAAPNAVGLCER